MVRIAEILSYLDSVGIPYTFRGDSTASVDGFSSLNRYKAGSITWVKAQGNIPEDFDTAGVHLAVVAEGVCGSFANVIVTAQSKKAFFAILEKFYGDEETGPAVGEYTYISPRVKLGKDVRIGCNCTLDGDIVIGDHTVIGHNVTMVNRVTVGKNSEIRSGVVIGHADSISYTEDENHHKTMIRHFGGVTVGDDVLIGENSTVCRGTIDDTVICDGVKIDALTQISHNCYFGKNSVAVSACRFCGSVTVEENAYLVGALVRNQCRIGAGAFVGMGSVVVKDVPAGETVVGNPARPFVKGKE